MSRRCNLRLSVSYKLETSDGTAGVAGSTSGVGNISQGPYNGPNHMWSGDDLGSIYNAGDNAGPQAVVRASGSGGGQIDESIKVSGWVKRKIFQSLDPAVQKSVAAAIKNGIVAPKGKQGIIKLTKSEAALTGFTHKVKILGVGGDIRIYGNQRANGHIFFSHKTGH